MKGFIAVAMSGGVDSSVAALILKEKGFDVFGMTAAFMRPCQAGGSGVRAVRDAAGVCKQLAIPHIAVDLSAEFKQAVITPFVEEYLSARTPNPCVCCNARMKFGLLRARARSLGARFFATGHYCRVVRRGKMLQLVKAKDKGKDQSYFLYRLTQPQLTRTLFPLGAYSKEQVRRMARDHRLPVAHKPDSQEICFLHDADYRVFIKRQMTGAVQPGQIVDSRGKVLGMHRGVAYYTIGQRQGLGLALGYPVFVTAIDLRTNSIVVGTRVQACSKEFIVRQVCWAVKAPHKKIAAKVRIRYNHREAKACVVPAGRKARVVFNQPQFAVTPGQSAVFYDRDRVLGGGIIERVAG